MYNVRNKKESAKMYSVIGKATTGGDFELVQNGMFGEIGKQIENDIYEFLPPSETAKDVFVLATPEVDPDESDFNKNTLRGFKLVLGQVGDAVQMERHAKGEISEDLIAENTSMSKDGYLYLKKGERKLTYKATKPDMTTDTALLIAKIEDIVPALQGIFIGANGKNLVPQTKNVVFRVIDIV